MYSLDPPPLFSPSHVRYSHPNLANFSSGFLSLPILANSLPISLFSQVSHITIVNKTTARVYMRARGAAASENQVFFFRPPTHFSHMSHPTFPISQNLILFSERVTQTNSFFPYVAHPFPPHLTIEFSFFAFSSHPSRSLWATLARSKSSWSRRSPSWVLRRGTTCQSRTSPRARSAAPSSQSLPRSSSSASGY